MSGLNGPGQGYLIGILDVHAHGDPAGQPGQPDPCFLQAPGKIRGSRLARHSGTGGNKNLFDPLTTYPVHQSADLYLVGPDTVHW